MHISDGLLPAPVCLGGYALTGLFTWYTLDQINRSPDPSADLPKASLLAAAFFVASSIRIPVPPVSVHLVMNGAMGVVLGWYAFPAILVALVFQALVLGHGGLTTLGVNAVMMGGPALFSGFFFRAHRWIEPWWRGFVGKLWRKGASPSSQLPNHSGSSLLLGTFAFLAGASGVACSTLIFFTVVITTIPAELDGAMEQAAIYSLMLAHIPVIALEGIFTMLLVLFLERVKPELLSRHA